jgi:hypothetical protein
MSTGGLSAILGLGFDLRRREMLIGLGTNYQTINSSGPAAEWFPPVGPKV